MEFDDAPVTMTVKPKRRQGIGDLVIRDRTPEATSP